MKRREFMAAATAALLVSPRSEAQGTPRRIGFLGVWADEPARDPVHAAWLSGLREKGWIEGKNLRVEWQRGASWALCMGLSVISCLHSPRP